MFLELCVTRLWGTAWRQTDTIWRKKLKLFILGVITRFSVVYCVPQWVLSTLVCIVLVFFFIIYMVTIYVLSFSSATSRLIKASPWPPFLSIESYFSFFCLYSKLFISIKAGKTVWPSLCIITICVVFVSSCRRSRRGVTPTCGKLVRRLKTLRRTSGMGSNSCCCWRSSQVTLQYDLISPESPGR